jgi:outer membrane protein assembly factor BamA
MRKKLLFPVTFLIFGFAILWAQVNPEGKKISSIKIEVIGPNTVGKSFVLQNLQVESGGEYEGSAIDRSIRNLTSSGTVNDVRVFIDQDLSSENEIALIFKVWTKSRIKSVLFEGNDKLSDRSLEKIISLNAGDLMDEATLKSDLSLLKERYLEKGYWNSIIDSQIIRDGKSENVSILYKIVEETKERFLRFFLQEISRFLQVISSMT